MIEFVLLTLGAYLLGAVPAAYLAIKWTRGVDIRKVGTGKVGASNVLNAGPKWAVVPVSLFDIGKGVLAVWVAQMLGMTAWEQVIVGLAAIIGHNWPVYLRFKSGGRGVFASLGVIFMLSWQAGLFALIFSYIFTPIRQIALGVFLAFVSLPLVVWFITPADDVTRVPFTVGMVAIAVMGLGKRLIARRSPLSQNTPWREIIIYRLLFDRDIRDPKLWANSAGSNAA